MSTHPLIHSSFLCQKDNDTSALSSEWQVRPTSLRMSKDYIQYYILTANFVVMGIGPCVIMVIFNVLVVRAVDEANKRR